MKVTASALQGLIDAVQEAGFLDGLAIESGEPEWPGKLLLCADLHPRAPPPAVGVYAQLTISVQLLERAGGRWATFMAIQKEVTAQLRQERREWQWGPATSFGIDLGSGPDRTAYWRPKS